MQFDLRKSLQVHRQLALLIVFTDVMVLGGFLAYAPLPSVHACNTCTYLTQWGSYGSGNGQFNGPTGIAVDGSGNVYVADQANNRVEKFGDQVSVTTAVLSSSTVSTTTPIVATSVTSATTSLLSVSASSPSLMIQPLMSSYLEIGAVFVLVALIVIYVIMRQQKSGSEGFDAGSRQRTCPNCGQMVGDEEHCRNCGQALR